jgi:hypothetical protein
MKLKYLFFLFMVVSCSKYPPEMESVLKLAGNNRKELEKTLNHYDKDPSDSLKLRAAEYLIANMPGKYSEYMEGRWDDVAIVYQRWTSVSDKRRLLDEHQLKDPVRKNDLMHITAAYLINNIELAFKVWQEQPWGKDISFDVFCETMLPYRIGNEPLEDWRKKALASFADLYKSFRSDTTITIEDAKDQVKDALPDFRFEWNRPPMNYSQLMATTRGLNDHQATLAVFVMRALGIPVAYESILRKIEPAGHLWYGVGNRQEKEDTHLWVYDENSIIDAASEYDAGKELWLPVPEHSFDRTASIFLAYLHEQEWHPAVCGVVDNDRFRFQFVKSGLYLPVYYRDGVQIPAGFPFRFQSGSCRIFQPYSSRTRSFTSTAPACYDWMRQMRGGKFEGANRSDFSDARTIDTITTIGFGYNVVPVNHTAAYRYVRYVSLDGGLCNVAILEFYDENNEQIQGAAIGTPGINITTTHDKAFDGDIDTYFEAAADPSWIRLDLGEPRRISRIRYLPRTEGTCIYDGHVYELFYWNGNGWQSLGKKTANSSVLRYQTPDNALFLLKNVTKNSMHATPFFIESGAQQWIYYN